MSESQREAMSVLTEIWSLSPDVRLGQLMSHLGFMGECYVNKPLPLLEDDEFIAILYRHRDELRARLGETPGPVVAYNSLRFLFLEVRLFRSVPLTNKSAA